MYLCKTLENTDHLAVSTFNVLGSRGRSTAIAMELMTHQVFLKVVPERVRKRNV